MLNYYLSISILILVVSAGTNDLSLNFEPQLDVLVPRKALQDSRNERINQNQETHKTPCERRSLDDERSAADSLDDPPPETVQERRFMQPESLNKVIEKTSPNKHEPVHLTPTNNEYLLNKEKSEEPQQALDLITDTANHGSGNGQLAPSELAAELQDCLEKKLHQKKPNVIVVLPVVEQDNENSDGADGNAENYLLTFGPPHAKPQPKLTDTGLRRSNKEDKDECENEDDKETKVKQEDLSENDNKDEKKTTANKNLKEKKSKVEKFLETGISEDSLEVKPHTNAVVDGRRRNNNYERLPLTEVIDSPQNITNTSTETPSSLDRSGQPERRICYACSSLNNPSCLSPNRMTTVKYCATNRYSCVKKTFETAGTTILVRDCASTCNDNLLPVGLVPKPKTCDLCHENLCNGAFSVTEQNLLILFFLTSWAFCKIIA